MPMARPSGLSLLTFRKVLLTVQIVHAALAASLVAALAIGAALLGRVEMSADLPAPALFLAGGCVTLLCLALGLAAPRLAAPRGPEAHAALRLQTAVIASVLFAASCEGAGLFWAILVPLTAEPLCLAGPGACLLVLLAFFPTAARLEQRLGMSEAEIDLRLAGLEPRP
ncbi:MAG: hypothetical protein HY812_20080 [Planctomycetes bacterium]|nr:hypothetical protein [Planctomycetota bacterium]